MGREKDRWMEEQEAGWRDGDDSLVCASCIIESYLSQKVTQEGQIEECDYCGATANPTLTIGQLMETIGSAITEVFSFAEEEGLPLDGSFDSSTWTSLELVEDLCISDNFAITEAIADCLSDRQWCRRDFYSDPRDYVLIAGWQRFVNIIKHETRFFFEQPLLDPGKLRSIDHGAHDHFGQGSAATLQPIPSPGEHETQLGTSVAEILRELGRLVEELQLVESSDSFVRRRNMGEVGQLSVFRARVQIASKGELSTAADFGPPEKESSVSNRMSPAGIVMFYGGLDRDTSIVETYDPNREEASKKRVWIGRFQATRPLLLLNLAEVPAVPSIFDEDKRGLRDEIRFLRDFVEDLTRPIARDGREHVEYVPTQVVTEFFRRRFRTEDGRALDGILYGSSKQPNGIAVVLFADRRQCGIGDPSRDRSDSMLKFVEGDIRSYDGATRRDWYPGVVHEV